MNTSEIKVLHLYESANGPKIIYGDDKKTKYCDDREVISIFDDSVTNSLYVSYDSASCCVTNPLVVSLEEFAKWAGRDITDIAPASSFRRFDEVMANPIALNEKILTKQDIIVGHFYSGKNKFVCQTSYNEFIIDIKVTSIRKDRFDGYIVTYNSPYKKGIEIFMDVLLDWVDKDITSQIEVINHFDYLATQNNDMLFYKWRKSELYKPCKKEEEITNEMPKFISLPLKPAKPANTTKSFFSINQYWEAKCPRNINGYMNDRKITFIEESLENSKKIFVTYISSESAGAKTITLKSFKEWAGVNVTPVYTNGFIGFWRSWKNNEKTKETKEKEFIELSNPEWKLFSELYTTLSAALFIKENYISTNSWKNLSSLIFDLSLVVRKTNEALVLGEQKIDKEPEEGNLKSKDIKVGYSYSSDVSKCLVVDIYFDKEDGKLVSYKKKNFGTVFWETNVYKLPMNLFLSFYNKCEGKAYRLV